MAAVNIREADDAAQDGATAQEAGEAE
jgi:hypothetical protein